MSFTVMEGLKTLYQVIRSDRRKERFEMILEPLQAVIQLALLSFCPIGSRLAISNNLLIVQIPCLTTSITRSYYQNCREDLVYLFSVITRFYKFYNYLSDKGGEANELFITLIDLGKLGLDRLIQTYSQNGHGTLIQQLKMYKSMLERVDFCWEKPSDNKYSEEPQLREDIDEVFIQIREIYQSEHISIILNILKLIKESPNDYENYMLGLNLILNPVGAKIQKWIHSHMSV